MGRLPPPGGLPTAATGFPRQTLLTYCATDLPGGTASKNNSNPLIRMQALYSRQATSYCIRQKATGGPKGQNRAMGSLGGSSEDELNKKRGKECLGRS